MKKYYTVVELDTITGEEWCKWEGSDLAEAEKAKEKALKDYDTYHTDSEKTHRQIECRVYELPSHTDFDDVMEIAEAMCHVGYDLV